MENVDSSFWDHIMPYVFVFLGVVWYSIEHQ